jgi:hypothetical protein
MYLATCFRNKVGTKVKIVFMVQIVSNRLQLTVLVIANYTKL